MGFVSWDQSAWNMDMKELPKVQNDNQVPLSYYNETYYEVIAGWSIVKNSTTRC